MIDRTHYGIVVFPSSQAAGQAELVFSESGRTSRLIPLPPQLSAGCGLVLQFDWKEREEIRLFLEQKEIRYSGVYEVVLTEKWQKTIRLWREKEER